MFEDLRICIYENSKRNDHRSYIYKITSISSFQKVKNFKTDLITALTKLFTLYVRKLEYNTPGQPPYIKITLLKSLSCTKKLYSFNI